MGHFICLKTIKPAEPPARTGVGMQPCTNVFGVGGRETWTCENGGRHDYGRFREKGGLLKNRLQAFNRRLHLLLEDTLEALEILRPRQAHDAGVKVVMVTGDHPDTARVPRSRSLPSSRFHFPLNRAGPCAVGLRS